MNNKIILILFFNLIYIQSQQILLQETDFTLETNQKKIESSWTQNNWQTTYSVSAWIKIDRYKYLKSKDSTIYHFTSNLGFKFQNNKNPGDRILSCFLSKDSLIFSTYSTLTGTNNLIEKIKIEENDINKWIFIYQGYSHNKKQSQIYVKIDGKEGIQFTQSSIYHQPSNYYKIFIGQSSVYSYFPGKIQRLVFQGGVNSYRDSNFEELFALNPNSLPQCPTVYSSCAFTGKSTTYCDDNAVRLAKPNFQSIYLPSKTSFQIKYPSLIQNEEIEFIKSVECLQTNSLIGLLKENLVTIKDSPNKKIYQTISSSKSNNRAKPKKNNNTQRMI